MKAIEIDGDRLVWRDTPSLRLGAGEVRIDVSASAVNRADLMQRAGHYPPPEGASPILGLECSGVVSEIADDVTGVAIGDEVCALLAGGGYATEVVVRLRRSCRSLRGCRSSKPRHCPKYSPLPTSISTWKRP